MRSATNVTEVFLSGGLYLIDKSLNLLRDAERLLLAEILTSQLG